MSTAPGMPKLVRAPLNLLLDLQMILDRKNGDTIYFVGHPFISISFGAGGFLRAMSLRSGCDHEGIEGVQNPPFTHSADGLMAQLATRKIEQRRNGPNPETAGECGILVHVDLCDLDAPRLFAGDFIQHRCKHLAGAAPLGPEVHKDRLS